MTGLTPKHIPVSPAFKHKAPVGLIFHPTSEIERLMQNPLLYRAKTGDANAAQALVAAECPARLILPQEIKALKGHHLSLLSVPGTTGKNKIPLSLTIFLADYLRKYGILATVLNGDVLLKVQHTRMLKVIPTNQRLFFPRRYAFQSSKAEKTLCNAAPLMLVEDLLLTGASAFAVKRFFEKNDIEAPFLAALTGTADIIPSPQMIQLVQTLLKRLDDTISWQHLTDELSREEVNALIVRLQQVFSDDDPMSRAVLKNRLILSYRERVENDTAAGRLLAADLAADIKENIAAKAYRDEIQNLFHRFNTTLDNA